MTRLQHAIEAARAAVTGRAGAAASSIGGGGSVQYQDVTTVYEHHMDDFSMRLPVLDPTGSTGGLLHRQPALSRAAEPPVPRILATFLPADEVRAGYRLSRGAVRLWSLLHRLAVDTARARAYEVTPDQVTFHCPAVTVAGVLGYHRSHLHKLADELTTAGLIDGGGHAQTVAGRNLYDGTLWAVATRPGVAVRVQADEWRHQWRPGFRSDYEGKTGALAEVQQLQDQQADEGKRYEAARRRAAIPDGVSPPVMPSCCIPPAAGLRAVVEQLPALWGAHARHRAREVGTLASAIAYALAEPERRRYWCRILWGAFQDENEGRGGLQLLGAQIARLAADLDEGAPWRTPGAVLAARLRTQ